MASDLLTKDLITYDPLSAITRKERTALLGLSMLGVALIKVPLVPEKFAFLGIEFAKVQQVTFVKLYALVIVYYLIAFTIYALTDYIAWRRMEVIQSHQYEFERRARDAADQASRGPQLPGGVRWPSRQSVHDRVAAVQPARNEQAPYKGMSSYWLGRYASRVRAVFEFLLPMVFGGWTFAELLRFVPKV